MSGYPLKIFRYDPIPGSIVQSSGTITVEIADNPSPCIYDTTEGEVPVWKGGPSGEDGYTVATETVPYSTYGENVTRYVISKTDGWSGNPSYLMFKPNLDTSAKNIYSTPSDVISASGENVTFACAYLNLVNPPTSFQWRKKSAVDGQFHDMSDVSGSIVGTRTRSLTLQNVTVEPDGSEYECRVVSGSDTIMSSISRLFVADLSLAASSEPSSVTTTFVLSVEGIPEILDKDVTGVEWKKDGAPIPETSGLRSIETSLESTGTHQYKAEVNFFGNQSVTVSRIFNV